MQRIASGAPDWGPLLAIASGLVVVACLAVAAPRPGVHPPAPEGQKAVATESEPASRAALSVLSSGGNAIDAAIAAALVGGVASPASSGLGGGGFALVFSARSKAVTAWDFRETSPGGIEPEAFDRRPLPSAERGKLVGVPGELAGLLALHQRFGRKPWRELVAPAARLAEGGFPASPYVSKAIGEKAELIALSPALADMFAPGGAIRPVGTKLSNPLLGRTLARIAEQGARAFYEGATARAIVENVRGLKGSLAAEDLTGYAPKERAALHVKWEGFDVYTMPPPSAGGLMLAQTLGAVSRADARRFDPRSSAYQHFLAELLRGSLADRMAYIGDPDDTVVDENLLLDGRRLRARREGIDAGRTRPLPSFFSPEHGTHHIVTADAEGNVVSLTTTINHAFGAGIVAGNAGVILNDELDDFASAPAAERLGIARSPNRARPRVRPVSSMAPTLVLANGAPVLALGASGGFTIGPAIAQIFLSLLAFELPPEEALRIPRFEIPTDEHTIALEPSVPDSFARELEARGEVPRRKQSVSTPAVQLLVLHGRMKVPYADRRKDGVALVE